VTIGADDQLDGTKSQLLTELHSQLAATHQLWDDEKRSVLAAVECVKTLVAQIQVHTSCGMMKSVLCWLLWSV